MRVGGVELEPGIEISESSLKVVDPLLHRQEHGRDGRLSVRRHLGPEELVDRSASPWDSPTRRPSHADKRRAWRRALLGEEIRAVLRPGVTEVEIQAAADRLLSLAA